MIFDPETVEALTVGLNSYLGIVSEPPKNGLATSNNSQPSHENVSDSHRHPLQIPLLNQRITPALAKRRNIYDVHRTSRIHHTGNSITFGVRRTFTSVGFCGKHPLTSSIDIMPHEQEIA